MNAVVMHHQEELVAIRAALSVNKDEALARCLRLIHAARNARDVATQLAACELYGQVAYVEGRNLLFEALQVAQTERMYHAEARIAEQIARSYYTTGQYRQASQFWQQASELAALPDGETQVAVLAAIGMGQVADAAGNPAQAAVHHRAAMSLLASVPDAYLAIKARINLAVNLVRVGSATEARVLLSEALTLAVEHHIDDYAAEARFRLAEIALADGRLEQAGLELIDARRTAQHIGYRWLEVNILGTLADVADARGLTLQAFELVLEAIRLAGPSDYVPLLVRLHARAADFAEELNQISAAYQHRSQQVRYMDLHERTGKRAPQPNDLGVRISAARRLGELARGLKRAGPEHVFAVSDVLQAAIPVLGVSAASFWHWDGTSTLTCVESVGPAAFDILPVWTRPQYPDWFRWMEQDERLVAHDALHHRYTAELVQPVLVPRAIASLIAWPIRVAGQVRGLMVCEQRGSQRNWAPDDVFFAGMLAHLLEGHLTARRIVEETRGRHEVLGTLIEQVREVQRNVETPHESAELAEVLAQLQALRGR
ncbi:GAF domain-containing protein [Chitinibacteraceae bacterium HSL-7]